MQNERRVVLKKWDLSHVVKTRRTAEQKAGLWPGEK
jgi:hypothetical protein